MIWPDTNTTSPRGSMNFDGTSFRLGILSTDTFSKISYCSAARYGPSSRITTSKGGLALEATIFETVSTASEATRLVEAPVALVNVGSRMERCADSHAPGKVVAEMALLCAKARPA